MDADPSRLINANKYKKGFSAFSALKDGRKTRKEVISIVQSLQE